MKTHTCTHTCTSTQRHTQTHTCTCTHSHTHTGTCIDKHTHDRAGNTTSLCRRHCPVCEDFLLSPWCPTSAACPRQQRSQAPLGGDSLLPLQEPAVQHLDSCRAQLAESEGALHGRPELSRSRHSDMQEPALPQTGRSPLLWSLGPRASAHSECTGCPGSCSHRHAKPRGPSVPSTGPRCPSVLCGAGREALAVCHGPPQVTTMGVCLEHELWVPGAGALWDPCGAGAFPGLLRSAGSAPLHA